MKKLPSHWQGLLWSKRLSRISLTKDKAFIINHILAYGDLDDVKELFSIYSIDELRSTFLEKPMKIYTPTSFNFIKKFVLHLNNIPVNERKYLKNTLRNIG